MGEEGGRSRVKYRANDGEIEEEIDYETEGVIRRMMFEGEGSKGKGVEMLRKS